MKSNRFPMAELKRVNRTALALGFTALLAFACTPGEDDPGPDGGTHLPDGGDGGTGDGACSATPPVVHFSHSPGFSEKAIDLELVSNDPKAVIRMTLDGSDPVEDSPQYLSSIRIASKTGTPNDLSEIPTNAIDSGTYAWTPPEGEVFKGTVVRARAWREDCEQVGPVATATYFVGPDLAKRFPLPVVSIATDKEHLFGGESGIYVPGDNYDPARDWTAHYYSLTGSESERPVHFELFEPGGVPSLSFPAGVRIHGGFSRRIPQKTLRFYLRSEYGLSKLEHPLFSSKSVSRFDRFLLRNSGNDWGYTFIIDTLAQSLLEDTRVDRQHHRSTLAFINGEYWGIQQLRDRLDARHFENHYGIHRDAVVVIDNHNEVSEGLPEDLDSYLALLSRVESEGLTDPQRYEWLQTQVDLDTFSDYVIANLFVRNHDWPFNNLKAWRHRVEPVVGAPFGADGRWRFAMFDLDLSFSWGVDRVRDDSLAHATQLELGDATVLLRRLLETEHFRTRFALRFADHLNTRFRSEHVLERIDHLANEIAASVPEHIHRWRQPVDVDRWKQNVERQREFARERPQHVRDFLQAHLGFDGWHRLSVQSSGSGKGLVRVNDHLTLDGEALHWSGLYPDGLPVRLRAHALPGSCFAGWVGKSHSSPLLIVRPTKNATVTALFHPDGHESCLPDPVPHSLADGDYLFEEWSDLEPAGVQPASMRLAMTETSDPSLSTEALDCAYEGRWDSNARTRANGLGEWGLAFVNTGNTDHCGWIGGVQLSLDTTGMEAVRVSFTAGTLEKNSREYALRLQYRKGDHGPFTDVHFDGEPIEYRAGPNGHVTRFDTVALPSAVADSPLVQLRWKYFFTGNRTDSASGARSRLRLDDIRVTAQPKDS